MFSSSWVRLNGPALKLVLLKRQADHIGDWVLRLLGQIFRGFARTGRRTCQSFDMQAYIQALGAAIRETLTEAAKFDRLATRLGAAGPDAKATLRERFERQALATYDYATRSAATFWPWGPARIDALSMINNRVTANLPTPRTLQRLSPLLSRRSCGTLRKECGHSGRRLFKARWREI